MKLNNKKSAVFVPVPLGELVDKITILQIKKSFMTSSKLENVEKELSLLEETLKKKRINVDDSYFFRLKNVNKTLWDIEDKIRMKESKSEFDQEFIDLARSVYIQNDKRFCIKKEINNYFNSDLVEEKSYEEY